MGSVGHQLVGTVTFKDEQNGLEGSYQFGAYSFSKQDYVYGEIKRDGQRVCEVKGNYCGYLDFGGVRYWDARGKDVVHHATAGEDPDSLPSQATRRSDGRFLIARPIVEAQEEKERLENLQRHDRKLREAAEKRRKAGGPKYAPKEAAE